MNGYISETIKDYIPILCTSLIESTSYNLVHFGEFEVGFAIFTTIILTSPHHWFAEVICSSSAPSYAARHDLPSLIWRAPTS